MKKWFIRLVILLAMMVVATTPGSLHVFAESDAVKLAPANAIEVELNDNYFNPKVITIPNGKSTTLVLKNRGKKEHTFTVDQLGVDAEVQPGSEKTITVTPKNPGTYELVCRYHLQQGMVGKVVVQ